MKLPKRPAQHISETASFKLFASKIPNNWIIRDVTERDYGIDCYLELVNDSDELTGELALIQLKSQDQVSWTKADYFTLSGVDIATSNYWFRFPIPVFIFLADIKNQELFFLSVDYYIKKNYATYANQTNFSYRVKREDKFEGSSGVFLFKFFFYYESYRQQFENEMVYFLSNLQHHINFQREHEYRDYHLGVEDEDLIYFEAMHRNYKFLCMYLNLDNPVPSLIEIKRHSKSKFPKGYYQLYEHDLTELFPPYQLLTSKITDALKSFLNGEIDFWLRTNPTIARYVRTI